MPRAFLCVCIISVSPLTSVSVTLVNTTHCALHIRFQSMWHCLPPDYKASSSAPHICLQLCPTGLQISSSSFYFHCWKAENQRYFTISIYGCTGQRCCPGMAQDLPPGGNITREAGSAVSPLKAKTAQKGTVPCLFSLEPFMNLY